MKVSINWLREYLDFDLPLEELADRLTMAGLEVEEMIHLSAESFTRHGGSADEDVAFDVKVTPNRGDWLSMIGVAREAAPLVGMPRARVPQPHDDGGGDAASNSIKISIADPDLCGRYVGAIVRNVTIKDSPDWMKNRLIAAGMRPINNIVDITNYVMLELGQPLHAFDLSLLKGAEIIVRRAREGEVIVSLDDVERKLEPDTLVIADSERAVAIAGVMGGADSEVGEQTKDILIESANFNPVSIRRTSKRLGMVTESSYRFERSVDPGVSPTAALRAAELMRELAGGEVASGIVDANPRPVEPVEISVRPERVNAVLGTGLDAGSMCAFLNGLELETTLQNDVLRCVIPTWRPDITREIDVVEEVGRAYGYDKFETTLPDTAIPGKDSAQGAFTRKLRRILMSCGMQEVLTHSLVDGRLAKLVGRGACSIPLRNPLSEDLDSMRVMLAPNLLQVIERNAAFGSSDVSVFEIGKVYYRAGDEIGERMAVGGAVSGNLWRSAWNLPVEALAVDFFTVKGIVESLLGGLGVEGARFETTEDPLLHPTRAARLMVGDRQLGILGEVAPGAAESIGIRERAYVFELEFEPLMEVTPETLRYEVLPRYPALHRHIDVVVDDELKYDLLPAIVRRAGEGLVERIELLDVYRGEHVGEGKRSLTLALEFRSGQRTLTDTEVNSVLAKVKKALQEEARAGFR